MTRSWLPRTFRMLLGMLMPVVLISLLLPMSARGSAPAVVGKAQVRAIHAVPDFGAVDVYVNGGRVLQNVSFITVSNYLSLDAGNYQIQVIPAGENITHPSLFVVNEHVAVVANRSYSVIARGSVAGHSVGATVLSDDLSAPTVGKVKVRAAHFSPNAPAVDVYVNGNKAISNLSFQNATDYLTVDPGTYTFGIAPAGGAVIYTSQATVAAGQVATIWANGLLGGSGAQAFKLTPSIDLASTATFRLRAVHAIPDLAGTPVDVYVNGSKALTFDFFTVSDYLTLYAGTYDLRVVPKGGNPNTDAAIQATVSFDAGKDYSVVARGTGGNFGASVLVDDNSKPAVGKVKVRAAHFSPNAPAVDVYVNGSKAISSLSFQNATDYLTVDPGTYTFGIAPAGGAVIYTSQATVVAGQVATIWANGLLGVTGAKTFKLTPSIDASFGSARGRFLHAIPGLGRVDVFVNGVKKVENLRFAQLTRYLALEPGNTRIEVRRAGSDTVVLSSNVTIRNGRSYTFILVRPGIFRLAGDPASGADLNVLEDDTTRPTDGNGRMRVVNLSPDLAAVDVFQGGGLMAGGLGYNQSASAPVPAGSVQATITAQGSTQALQNVTVAVAPGGASSVFVVGLNDTQDAEQRLQVVSGADVEAAYSVILPLVSR